jgi:aconitate hydratase
MVRRCVTPAMFKRRYADVFKGDAAWRAVAIKGGASYAFEPDSTYVRHPPYFTSMPAKPAPLADIIGARPLAILGDSITTDHISPAGSIKTGGPAGKYLVEHKVDVADFNSFGARRGNHEVMMRGTFANIALKNEMAAGTVGGVTRHMPDGQEMPIYDAAMRYQGEKVPLVIVAGKEYGTGSSRDWAAKGTTLLGVRAVIAESFERIHRSNLIGMGVLPLQFAAGVTRKTLNLDGSELFEIRGLAAGIKARMSLPVTIKRQDGRTETIATLCRIDTVDEEEYFRHGGILPYVLRNLAKVA